MQKEIRYSELKCGSKNIDSNPHILEDPRNQRKKLTPRSIHGLIGVCVCVKNVIVLNLGKRISENFIAV